MSTPDTVQRTLEYVSQQVQKISRSPAVQGVAVAISWQPGVDAPTFMSGDETGGVTSDKPLLALGLLQSVQSLMQSLCRALHEAAQLQVEHAARTQVEASKAWSALTDLIRQAHEEMRHATRETQVETRDAALLELAQRIERRLTDYVEARLVPYGVHPRGGAGGTGDQAQEGEDRPEDDSIPF